MPYFQDETAYPQMTQMAQMKTAKTPLELELFMDGSR